jgi:hypothetical protein
MRTHPRDRESDAHEKQCCRREPSVSEAAEGVAMTRFFSHLDRGGWRSLFEEGLVDLGERVRDDLVCRDMRPKTAAVVRIDNV